MNEFKEKNGKLCTRMLLATSDCEEGYSSVASLVVQAYAPIGTEEFGDGRKAVLALEAKYRVDGTFRMQELHDTFGSLEVTADDKYDPALPAAVAEEAAPPVDLRRRNAVAPTTSNPRNTPHLH